MTLDQNIERKIDDFFNNLEQILPLETDEEKNKNENNNSNKSNNRNRNRKH